MTHFNRFCKKAQRAAARVGGKMEEIGENAALSLKIKHLESEIEVQYERLGKVVYRDLHTDKDLENKKLEIIASIDALFDELAVLKERKNKAKAQGEQ